MDKKALANALQLTPELMGLSTNMISMAAGVSASRGQMEGGQAAQTLVLKNPDYPRTYTGVEQEMAKYTFAARAPFNAEVVRTIDKFRVGINRGTYVTNPSTFVIVRNLDSNHHEYDMIDVPSAYSYHNNFGYMTVPKPAMTKARQRGAYLKKGEVLVDSPSNGPEGFYRRGLLTNVIYMTSPYVTEDGFWASEEWCQRAASTGIGEIFINIPKDHYLLPIYGEGQYFPSLGEKIRPDGMVLCTRESDPILDAFYLTKDQITDVDLTFDEPKFIEGSCHNATVIDIEVYVNEERYTFTQPASVDEFGTKSYDQLLYIWEEHKRFSRELIEAYELIEASYKGSHPPVYSGRLTSEIEKAMHIVNYKGRLPIKFLSHGSPIAIATIRIQYKYDIVPEIGSKIAGDFGDKGVICRKTPAADMPKDKYGNVAELVSHATATINRMIPARLDDHFLGAQCLLREREIRALWEEGRWEDAFDIAAKMQSVVNPRAYAEKFIPFMVTQERRYNHVKSIVEGHMMFELKPGDSPNYINLTKALQEAFPYKKGPVIFTSTMGKRIKTKVDMLIGTSYIRILEKTGHDWGAVDSPTRQAHGIAAKISHRDRNSRPWRKQPYRYGESEIRPIVALIGEDWAADILDRSNNPVANESILKTIMEAKKPTNIDRVIDRKKIPVGNSVTNQYLRNEIYTRGAMFKRKIIDKKRKK